MKTLTTMVIIGFLTTCVGVSGQTQDQTQKQAKAAARVENVQREPSIKTPQEPPQQPPQEAPQRPPVRVVKYLALSARGGILNRSSELSIECQNDSTLPVKSVEIQLDIFDSIRRVIRDRVFIDVDYSYGLVGSKSILPGKSKRTIVHVDYVIPRGVGDGYGTYTCNDCIKINVVHFKDGSTWERKGWRDEPNPNR